MGRTTKPLTDTELKKARPAEKEYKLSDGEGLFLVIKPNSKKVWRVNFTLNGKRKPYTIGNYPTVTLATARTIAKDIRYIASTGVDPVNKRREQQVRQEDTQVVTFKSLAESFLKHKELEWTNSKNIITNEGRLKNYVYNPIGSKAIADISRQDIIDLIREIPYINVGGTRKSASKFETAKRTHQLVSQVFKHAIAQGLITVNPTNDIQVKDLVPKAKSEKMKAILDIVTLRRLYSSFDEYSGSPTLEYALKFLALSALRPGNIQNLKWEYVDYANDLIMFPPEAMKAREEFHLPLTPKLTELLDKMKPITRYNSEYVFCSPVAPSKKISENSLNQAHKRMGYNDHTAHGWRSSFSTNSHENQESHGFSSDIIETQLAHSVGNEVKRAYMRSLFVPERHRLLLWWEGYLTIRD